MLIISGSRVNIVNNNFCGKVKPCPKEHISRKKEREKDRTVFLAVRKRLPAGELSDGAKGKADIALRYDYREVSSPAARAHKKSLKTRTSPQKRANNRGFTGE